MTLRPGGGWFFPFAAAPALLSLSVTDTLFQGICTFSFADTWVLATATKPETLRRDLRNYPDVYSWRNSIFGLFTCRWGGCIATMAVHCGLLFETPDPLSTLYSIAGAWPTKELFCSEGASSPWPFLFIFPQMFCRNWKDLLCLVLLWATYFWAHLGAPPDIPWWNSHRMHGPWRKDPPWTWLFFFAVQGFCFSLLSGAVYRKNKLEMKQFYREAQSSDGSTLLEKGCCG